MNKYNQIYKSRIRDNHDIVNIINDYMKQNPDIRFFQALYNLGIMDNKNIDRFYEEPGETLTRMMTTDFVKNYKKEFKELTTTKKKKKMKKA